MAPYRFCLIVVTLLGVELCHAQRSVQDTMEQKMPSLVKEVEDNSRYKTLEANATLLKLLVDDKDGVSKSEVFDMLHSRDDDQDHVDLPVFPEDEEDTGADVPAAPDAQVEILQEKSAIVRKDSMRSRYSASRGEPIGAAAGIMVLITCSIVCIGYIAVVVWRKIYLKRNGLKHELLKNEENIAETRLHF